MARYYAHTATSVPTDVAPHSFVLAPSSDDATVQQLIDAFLADYKQRHGKDIAVDELAKAPITDVTGCLLTPSDPLSLTLEPFGDVFLTIKSKPASTSTPAKTSPLTSTSTAKSTTNAPSTAAAKSTPPAPDVPLILNDVERAAAAKLEEATKAHSEGRLRQALQMYDTVLDVLASSPSERDGTRLLRQRAFSQSGVVHLMNRRYEAARKRMEKAVQLTSLTYRLVTPSSPARPQQKKAEQARDDAELFTLLARCYLHLRDWDEAELALTKARELLASIKGQKGVANALADAEVLRVQVLLDSGDDKRRPEAVSLIESLIASHEQHVPTLVRYAKLAIDGGQTLPTIPYLLRAVVNLQPKVKQHPVDDDTRTLAYSLFASMVSKPQGVEALYSALGQAASAPASLVFLAQTLKDHSAIPAATALYRKAVERTLDADVEKAGVVLNLVHTLEVAMEYKEAWKALRTWMQHNQAKSVGTLRVGQFWQLVQSIDDIRDPALLTGEASYSPAWREIPPAADEGQVQVSMADVESASALLPSGSSTSVSGIKPHLEYSSEALNILALLFTAVKLLFVCGALQPLPALIALIEPVRVHKQLHLTLIRNEHAYHSTIAQILRTLTYPLPPIPPSQHIYVLGDSHCLSSAFSIIHLPSPSSPSSPPTPHLLRPLLSTGTKIYHLRPSCTFYPHANYEAALRLLPSTPSTIIASFGEIDCREGLLVAVEKGKYEGGMDEAVTAVVGMYEKEWDRWVAMGHRVWVHPVQPVLDVTRPVVKRFEKALRERVQARMAKEAKAGGRKKGGKGGELHYLDLFDDLLTPDGGFNAAEYGMDGTHIHPRYVRLIEREMSARPAAAAP